MHGVDPAKLLLDPYARQVDTTEYELDVVRTPGVDSAGFAPLGVVTGPPPRPRPGPGVAWEDTVFYEAHVKGLTHLHPDVPPELRGTYAGVAHPAVIEHLQSLHVTSLELLPVHATATEPGLLATGRANYWGYSTLSYFAVHPEVREPRRAPSSRSSPGWSTRCTPPASRSSSTWSTTTPPRAASTSRSGCRTAGWTGTPTT